MSEQEEPGCIHLFQQNPVFTSLHLKSPVHVIPLQENVYISAILDQCLRQICITNNIVEILILTYIFLPEIFF
jgi:hypothetical protein